MNPAIPREVCNVAASAGHDNSSRIGGLVTPVAAWDGRKVWVSARPPKSVRKHEAAGANTPARESDEGYIVVPERADRRCAKFRDVQRGLEPRLRDSFVQLVCVEPIVDSRDHNRVVGQIDDGAGPECGYDLAWADRLLRHFK